MYSEDLRGRAAMLRLSGQTWGSISARLGVSVSTLLRWQREPDVLARRLSGCPRCGNASLPATAYSALLGFYLGDGHIARVRSSHVLRISCDAAYAAIIDDVASCIDLVQPDRRVRLAPRPGCVNVQSQWKHWPCLFPQHGPGPKHQRPIELQTWQRDIVEAEPSSFLRGLFHSDGCRTRNCVHRPVAGSIKTYCYPRWQFVNASADIRGLCCWALDLAGVAWRRSNTRVISVSRGDAVARLDDLIGLKR